MKRFSAQAPLRLNLLGYPAILGGPSLNFCTQTTVEVAIYPLEEEELAFRLPDQDEVIRFEARGYKQLLGRRGKPESLRLFLSDSAAPAWAQRALLHLYQFCRENHWQPAAGLLVDFQTDLPDGFGLGIEEAWLNAMKRALRLFSGIGKTLLRSKKQPSTLRSGTQIEELDSARSPIPKVWHLPPELVAVTWIADQADGGAEGVGEHFHLATRMGQVAFETTWRRSWPHPSALTIPMVRRADRTTLPQTLTGAEFKKRYPAGFVGHDSIDDQREYPLQASLDHLLQENQRSTAASLLLQASSRKFDEDVARLIGQYLIQSHEERSALVWKNRAADQMIDTLMDLGPKRGIYGARLVDRGLGGFAVLVLLHSRAWRTLKSLRHQIYFSTEGPWPFLV